MKKVNLTLVLLLGAVPAVASSATIKGAVVMGIATGLVMVLTALVMSKLERSTATVVAVTTVISCVVDLLLHAFLPSFYALAGMYIALLACNMLTYSASRNTVSEAFSSAVLFAIVLVVVAAARELLANVIPVMSKEYCGLFIYAFAAALCNKIGLSNEDSCVGSALGLCQKEGE